MIENNLWTAKIEEGMRLIVEGCKGNHDWTKCNDCCLFNDFCTSIWKDNDHDFSTPDTWEEEGLLLD